MSAVIVCERSKIAPVREKCNAIWGGMRSAGHRDRSTSRRPWCHWSLGRHRLLGERGGVAMNARRNSAGGSRSGQPRKNARSGSRLPANGASVKVLAVEEQVELERFVATRPRARPKLGGSQIEGRQAVRELLLAQRRRVQRFGSRLT